VKISWIEPDILAASAIPIDAKDLQSLHDQGVRAIISLTEWPLTLFKSLPMEVFSALDITYLHTPVPDQHPPTIEQAHTILQFVEQMRQQQRAVLVHCHAGIGRTGTILHLYYIAQGLSFEQAREQVKLRRPQSILLSDEQKAFLNDFIAAMNKKVYDEL
jgi:atypical dual specificity phosphatase